MEFETGGTDAASIFGPPYPRTNPRMKEAGHREEPLFAALDWMNRERADGRRAEEADRGRAVSRACFDPAR
jgi:hypothetical protein